MKARSTQEHRRVVTQHILNFLHKTDKVEDKDKDEDEDKGTVHRHRHRYRYRHRRRQDPNKDGDKGKDRQGIYKTTQRKGSIQRRDIYIGWEGFKTTSIPGTTWSGE